MKLDVNTMIRFNPFLVTGKNMSQQRFFQTKFVKCGVPQGSTSGPLYFLIYSNGPTDALEKFIVHHFTKDWPRANKLSLNESKTKLLLLVN